VSSAIRSLSLVTSMRGFSSTSHGCVEMLVARTFNVSFSTASTLSPSTSTSRASSVGVSSIRCVALTFAYPSSRTWRRSRSLSVSSSGAVSSVVGSLERSSQSRACASRSRHTCACST
jgi:hypothetical protein